MRHFEIGFGMGNGADSLRYLRTAVFRLLDAFSHMSGMEQNGGQGTRFDHERQLRDWAEVEDIARDLLTILGFDGNDIELKRRLRGLRGDIIPLPDYPRNEDYAYITMRERDDRSPPDPDGDEVMEVRFNADCQRLCHMASVLFEKAPVQQNSSEILMRRVLG